MDYHESLGDGLHRVDVGHPHDGHTACYILGESGRFAIIDTGTFRSVGRIMGALEKIGVDHDQVDWVMPTHVHLDHAGGAGELLARLPNAKMLIHPEGLKHMIEPSRLVTGTKGIFGEAFYEEYYIQVTPAPADRLVEATAGMDVSLAGRTLQVIDAPGHARHHYVLWEPDAARIFAGDAFGNAYADIVGTDGKCIAVTPSAPNQFDPETWKATLDMMVSKNPKSALLAHFGTLNDLAYHADALRADMDDICAVARGCAGEQDLRKAIQDALAAQWAERIRSAGYPGSPAEIAGKLEVDLMIASGGLVDWLSKQ